MKNILMLASEAVPFIKTGGLADVVGSLPKTIDKRYFDCRVMIPKYMCIPWDWRQNMQYVTHFYMDYLGQSRYVGVLKYELDGITYYFIDNESYFSVTSLTATGTGISRSSVSSVMQRCPHFRFLTGIRISSTAMTGRQVSYRCF